MAMDEIDGGAERRDATDGRTWQGRSGERKEVAGRRERGRLTRIRRWMGDVEMLGCGWKKWAC
jgi:hypothetical protein